MKQALYFILTLIIFSCSNRAEKKEMYKVEDTAKEAMVQEHFVNEIRTKQKLQDYYDLLVLEQKNPEFKEAILKEIQNISSTDKTVNDTIVIRIENLKLLGEIAKVSDTVQKMKIAFDKKTIKKTKKDTIDVIITTKKVIIDGNELVSSKIRFLKN